MRDDVMGPLRFCAAFIFTVILSFYGAAGHHRPKLTDADFTRDFAVELHDDGDENVADLVANVYGFKVIKRLANLGNVYYFKHKDLPARSRRSADQLIQRLREDPNVKRVEQQWLLKREKREIRLDELQDDTGDDSEPTVSKDRNMLDVQQRLLAEYKFLRGLDTLDKPEADAHEGYGELHMGTQRNEIDSSDVDFNDPKFAYQWYLQENRRYKRSLDDMDLNLGVVWNKGITGKGVVVTVLDDGVLHSHPDLQKNYDPRASADLNDRNDATGDPTPNTNIIGNDHGTKCAGEIAAEANNKICGVGVAFNCKIGGVRMLDGDVTDITESDAVSFGLGYIDVYSVSWGPRDNGKIMEEPGYYCKKALEAGVTKGRNGLGSIYVWATGNGGLMHDNCNCDGYVSSIYTLSIGSVTSEGLSTYYSEACASTLAVVYTGGPHSYAHIREFKLSPRAVVTTDLFNGCTESFVGTSGAAPLAAGCVALTLEANPSLSWRDMQHIVVESARITNPRELVWRVNGAGKHVSHEFGFGMMDCGRMVELAQNWTNVHDQHKCIVPDKGIEGKIPSRGSVNLTLETDRCKDESSSVVTKLEHVEAVIKLNHTYRGDVFLQLVSPSGMRSEILRNRKYDDDDDGINFTFMSVHFWGEEPSGTWTLIVTDRPGSITRKNTGIVFYFSLIVYGTSEDKSSGKIQKRDTYKASGTDLNNMILKERKVTTNVQIKRLVENEVPKDSQVSKGSQHGESVIPTLHSPHQLDLIKQEINALLSPERKDTLPNDVRELYESRDLPESAHQDSQVSALAQRLDIVLKENGFTMQDLINAIDTILEKIDKKIEEKAKNNDSTTEASSKSTAAMSPTSSSRAKDGFTSSDGTTPSSVVTVGADANREDTTKKKEKVSLREKLIEELKWRLTEWDRKNMIERRLRKKSESKNSDVSENITEPNR